MINTTASKDAFTLIQLGILNGVSFEFEDIKSDWGVDQKTHRQTRVIREAKLRAISIGVLRPYYKENVSQVIKGGKDDRTDDGVNEAAEARQLEQKQLVNNTEKQLDFNSLLLSAVIK
jgi:phage head maturation protease